MVVIGLSLLVASFVVFALRPPQWLPRFLARTFGRNQIPPPPARPPVTAPEWEGEEDEDSGIEEDDPAQGGEPTPPSPIGKVEEEAWIPVTEPDETSSDETEQNEVDEELVEAEDETTEKVPIQASTPTINEEPFEEQSIQEPTPTTQEELVEEESIQEPTPATQGELVEEQATQKPTSTIQEKSLIQITTTESEAIIHQEPLIQVTTPPDDLPVPEAEIVPSIPATHELSAQDVTSSFPKAPEIKVSETQAPAIHIPEERDHDEEQTTPKANAIPTVDNVPSLFLPKPSEPTSAPSPAPTTPSLAFPSIPTSPPAPTSTPAKVREVARQTSSPSLVLPKPSTPSKIPQFRQQQSRIPTPPSRIPSPPKVAGRSASPRRDISPRRANMNTSDQQRVSSGSPAPPAPSTSQAPAPAPAPAPLSSSMMPPPPVPQKPRPSSIPQFAGASSSSPSPRRIPTLDPTSSRERNLPIPRRGGLPTPSSLGGGLAPPPTHSSIPKKPSRQVTLEPGHSPMDWARLAQSPTSDLRNLPPHTPYLRVTPSMLKQMNGRKGNDAWSVYGGKVYNVTPYMKFHPGGAGELLRGAGKDATRLFGEVHPWVNYETMLSACLIGILVEEHETENKMEEMD